MNSLSHAAPSPPLPDPAEIPAIRLWYWSVRRELWENRSTYLAPLAVAVLILVGFLFGLIHLPDTLRAASLLEPAQRQERIEQPYSMAALLLMFTATVVALFYCLDAIYGERRDRSILFWKSLPVSDLTSVLAKASIPIIVLPLLTFALTVLTQGLMLLLAGARLMGTGLSVWSHLSVGQMWTMLFNHLVFGHGLWYAPFWGWLLMWSAWSRRAPLLWATLPLLALGLVEKIAFNTALFGNWIGYRFMGSPADMAHSGHATAMDTLISATPGQFAASPGFWFGLALTAVFLAIAVRLRRYREPV